MNTVGELRMPTAVTRRPLASVGEQPAAAEPHDQVSSGPEFSPALKKRVQTPPVAGELTLRVAQLAFAAAMDPSASLVGALFAPTLRSNADSGVLAVTRHTSTTSSTQYSLPDGTDVFQSQGLKANGDVATSTSAQRSEMKLGQDGMLVNHITLLKANVNGAHIEVTNPDGTLTLLNTHDLGLETR